MSSAQALLPMTYVIIALLCVPPLLALLASFRWYRRRARKRAPQHWAAANVAFAALALVVNCVVTIVTVRHMTAGSGDLGALQALAAGFAWLSLWQVMLALIVSRRRGRMAY